MTALREQLLDAAPSPTAGRIIAKWPQTQTPTELRARTVALLEVLAEREDRR